MIFFRKNQKKQNKFYKRIVFFEKNNSMKRNITLKFLYLSIISLFLPLFLQASASIKTNNDSTQKYFIEITHSQRKKIVNIEKGDRVSIKYFGKNLKGRITDIQENFVEINQRGKKIKIPFEQIERIQRLSWGTKIARIFSDLFRYVVLPAVAILAVFFILTTTTIFWEEYILLAIMLSLYGLIFFSFFSLPYFIQKKRFAKPYWNIKIKRKS